LNQNNLDRSKDRKNCDRTSAVNVNGKLQLMCIWMFIENISENFLNKILGEKFIKGMTNVLLFFLIP
jgi:hypothetical protein